VLPPELLPPALWLELAPSVTLAEVVPPVEAPPFEVLLVLAVPPVEAVALVVVTVLLAAASGRSIGSLCLSARLAAPQPTMRSAP
jgi:hypothetical protein